MDEIVQWFNIEGYEEQEGAGGVFDVKSMTPKSIDKKTFPNGMGYVVTCIDRKGVTLDLDFPPKDVTPEIERFYKIYQMVKQNPAVKKLFDGVVIKLLGEMMSQQ